MSLQTGILSNTNNEMSQQMARNSQYQSTATRKVRGTCDAADTSKQLQLQIDTEVEKHRALSQLTKDLRAQLKAAKSGHGKGANLSPSATEFDVHIPTASEPSVTEFDINIPPVPSTADFIDPAFDSTFAFMSDFEFNTLLSDVEHLDTVFAAANILPTFDPGLLDCGGSTGFRTLVPNSGSMLPTFFSDPIGTSNFSPFAPSDTLLLIPPPPPDSPWGASPTVEEPASNAPKSCCGSQREVGEANIMTSTHSRVPSTCKRVADEAPILNHLPKKGKGRQ
ncbi:hypothetical protein DFH08DRAFT_867745, partial [Mycena albidolilacea]